MPRRMAGQRMNHKGVSVTDTPSVLRRERQLPSVGGGRLCLIMAFHTRKEIRYVSI